jgi:hypothetical protein
MCSKTKHHFKVYSSQTKYPKTSSPGEFGKFGELKDVYIPKDFHTGQQRDFGFVEYWDSESADQAIAEMDGNKVGKLLIS